MARRRQKRGAAPDGSRSRKKACPCRCWVPRNSLASRIVHTCSEAGGERCRNFRNAGNRVDRPGTASRTPVRSGPAAAAAAWPALPARRAAPWEAHHARRSCKPPEDRDAAIAKVSPACHKAGLGSDHLTLAAVMAQLSYCFHNMVETPDMRLAKQAAMGVDR